MLPLATAMACTEGKSRLAAAVSTHAHLAEPRDGQPESVLLPQAGQAAPREAPGQ